MPAVRARMGAPVSNTVVGRTALNIDGRTRDASGTLIPGAVMRLFRTIDDLLRGRTVSDGAGRYSMSPYDFTGHYATAVVTGAADSTILTSDSTYLTADRSGQIAGISPDTLVGV